MKGENSEMKQIVNRQLEEKKKDNFYDKVLNFLQSRVVIVGQNGLDEFPRVICRPGQGIQFDSGADQRNIFEVQNNRR